MVNVSDPSSRLMPTRRDFLQGYNAQLAVTADQIIVAVQVGQSTNDQAAFVPMMHATQQVGERLHQRSGDPQHAIGTVLADAGYASDANLAAPGPDRLIALGKARDQAKTSRAAPALDPAPTDATPRELMRHRLRTDDGARLYKRRGATVEPGIGNGPLIRPAPTVIRRTVSAATVRARSLMRRPPVAPVDNRGGRVGVGFGNVVAAVAVRAAVRRYWPQ